MSIEDAGHWAMICLGAHWWSPCEEVRNLVGIDGWLTNLGHLDRS